MVWRLTLENGAFGVFQLRARNGVITRAAVAYVLIATAIAGGWAWANRGALIELASLYLGLLRLAREGGAVGEQEMNALLAGYPSSAMTLGYSQTLMIFCLYVARAAFEAACLRWMIRGETDGVFGLSLGADTWRVYLAYWIWYFIGAAYWVGSFLILFITGGAVALAAGGGDGMASPQGFLALPVIAILLLCLWVYLATRYAPAAATAIAQKTFRYMDAWRVTKGQAFALLGSFGFLWLIYVVAWTILFGVGAALAFVFVVPKLGELGADATLGVLWAALNSPGLLAACAGVVLTSYTLNVLLWLCMMGVNARAVELAIEDGRIERVV